MASTNEIGKAMYSILTTDATVAGLVSTKVYPNTVPKDVAFPFVVYTTINTTPADTKDGVSPLDEIQVQVDVYSTSYDTTTTLANACRGALDRYSGTVASQAIQRIRFVGELEGEYEEEVGVWWKSQDYMIRLKRER